MIILFLIFVIFTTTMIAAAYHDATTMKIPNWISLALIAGFFLVQPFIFQGWEILGTHLIVGGVFFLAGFAMFAFGWFGGGDAKLMAATALWWQWSDVTMYISYTTLSGAVLALILLFGRKFFPVNIATSPFVYKMFKEEKNMPYGLALAAGAFFTLPQSAIFAQAIGN